MPLTDTQIRNVKSGLRPERQSGEGEKGKRSPSKGQEKAKDKVLVEGSESTGNDHDPKGVETDRSCNAPTPRIECMPELAF